MNATTEGLIARIRHAVEWADVNATLALQGASDGSSASLCAQAAQDAAAAVSTALYKAEHLNDEAHIMALSQAADEATTLARQARIASQTFQMIQDIYGRSDRQ